MTYDNESSTIPNLQNLKLQFFNEFLSVPGLQLQRLKAEKAKRSFKDFVIQAWPVLEPEKFIEGMHIDAICARMKAVTEGETAI